MKKKAYLTPETTVVNVELQLMTALSGGDPNNNVNISDEADDSDADNRSRRRSNPWDDEEEF